MFFSLLTGCVWALTLSSTSAQATKCTVPAILDARVNPWKNHTLHPTSLYRQRVEEAVAAIKDQDLKERASRVANFGTFVWLKSPEDTQEISRVADEVPCDEILGLVLDNLPYKRAVPNRPPPEYDPNAEEAYRSLFIERKSSQGACSNNEI
ncbi:hypothetical protein NUW58_g9688 [Xylaria curta]|uniref:Uncharacterized protein n=1 Tax=Xylaria curta TaxID=42375 RepID=A0ACC1MUE6_9PEZI|nr:hypothetical protein NUW58_g9688 [Xylaria curta]